MYVVQLMTASNSIHYVGEFVKDRLLVVMGSEEALKAIETTSHMSEPAPMCELVRKTTQALVHGAYQVGPTISFMLHLCSLGCSVG